MSSLLPLYFDKLQHFHKAQIDLETTLNKYIKLIPVEHFGYSFSPTHLSVAEQIRHWTQDAPTLSPALWVEPRKGVIELAEEQWEFGFHGPGELSFVNNVTRQEVDITYSAEGEIGMTKWNIQVFLETFHPHEDILQELLSHHDEMFNQLTETGHLVKRSTIIPFDDEVFVLALQDI